MDSTLDTTSTTSPSIINSTNVFKPDDIVPSIAVNNSISNSNNINNNSNNQFKKCIHHRMSHCGRTAVVQSQQRVVRVGNGSAVITGGINSCSNVAGATGNSSSSVVGQQNGAINSQVGIQSQPGLIQPVSAALLADRYLLLDLVDGSSLYRCIDVRSHDELVCKVNIPKLFFKDSKKCFQFQRCVIKCLTLK